MVSGAAGGAKLLMVTMACKSDVMAPDAAAWEIWAGGSHNGKKGGRDGIRCCRGRQVVGGHDGMQVQCGGAR
ncbi:hypothetical protein DUNSADRAFT_9202, partial [Dunaliella salina]